MPCYAARLELHIYIENVVYCEPHLDENVSLTLFCSDLARHAFISAFRCWTAGWAEDLAYEGILTESICTRSVRNTFPKLVTHLQLAACTQLACI